MDFLYYDIRVAVIMAVFYMFYRLLLGRDSLHQLNRFMLLGTAVASFVLPLCVITIHHTEILQALPATPNAVASLMPGQSMVKPLWQRALLIVFWAGMIITLLYTLVSISKVCILISRCERHRQADGTVIAVSDGEVSPFSWMHYIVLSRSDYAHADRAILMHEREHVRRHHSWDVVLVDVLTSLQWFNPAMWMLRHDLRSIHEYEADAAVLSSGVDARRYQYLLVRKAMTAAGYSVVNGINHSTLRQRITMMNNKSQSKYSWIKAFYVVPVVAVSLFASAKTVTDYKVVPETPAVAAKQEAATINAISMQKKQKVTAKYAGKGKKGVMGEAKTKSGNGVKVISETEKGKILDIAEVMPQFPGGPAAMMKYLNEHVNYPAEAHAKGIQGRVVVTFIVNADGSISNATVVRSVDPLLDQEALQVVTEMPKWNPGMQGGKPVGVKYTIPISFRLQ